MAEQRMTVRRLESEDLPTRVQWFTTPSIYRQMPIDVPISLEDTRRWFANNALDQRRRDFVFEAHSDAGPTRVAMGGLVDIDRQHGRAELYILVDPERTGQGYGTRAVQWLCNYAFAELGLVRVWLKTVDLNTGARHLYQRLGFQHEGTLRSHLYHRGRRADHHVLGMLRDEWTAQDWHREPPISLEL
jgi:RimJ/RimL family protein N-acetyltransferase